MSDPSRHDFFRCLRAQAQAARQRRVVLLQGAADWYRDVLTALPAALEVDAERWFGVPPPGWTEFSGGAVEVLGRELDLVGVDMRGGLDPDAFGALSGSLRAGGLLLLCGPPLEAWSGLAGGRDAGMRFLARWAGLLAMADEATELVEGYAWPALSGRVSVLAPLVPDADGCLTADQRIAVDAVRRVATGHRRRPAVLTEPVFACAAAQLSGAGRARGVLHCGEGELRFVAPDALVREPRNADLLLVDEAAALPVGLLGRLLERYARIAFATTVHGYEGSGRAFSVRFGGMLERRTPGWRGVRLEEPVRWAAGDPLEALATRLLLLDAEPAPDEAVAQAVPDECGFERIDRDRLVADEGRLRELFGLMVLAHYRTRPRDLQQWLDGDGVSLWGLRHRGHLVGVAIGVREGGLDAELAAAVGRGERRVRGHLIAQSLAAHLGGVEDARLRGLRIVRIAVHPAVQGRGLGGCLLQGVAGAAREDGVDWIGASFGAEADLMRFWHGSGFSAVRMGFTREATSGAHAALMLRGLTPAGEALAARAAARFAAGLPAWLGDALRTLAPELVLELLAQSRQPEAGVDALREAERFSRGWCEVEDAMPWLRELCLARLGKCRRSGEVDAGPAEAMLLKLVQTLAWDECAARLGVPGRAQVVEQLREGVAALLRFPVSDARGGGGHDA
ncbi:MAG: GNAT family N-acetyltransferase [Acidihalobacter sp.]